MIYKPHHVALKGHRTCNRTDEEDYKTDTRCCDIERDSQKDEAVVFIFIIATGGLLAWAVFKPWIERYLEVRKVIHSWRWQRLTRGAGSARTPIIHTRCAA